MKNNTKAAIGAWLAAAVAAVALGSAMREPTAAAGTRPTATTGPITITARGPATAAAEPAPIEIPITIAAPRPQAAPQAAARHGGCHRHTLVQGGSPQAPDVLACD